MAQAVDTLAEQNGSLPEPTPIEQIELPGGSDLVAYFMVGVTPPDPSERVNVYLPKSLVERIDRRAAELGMTRSSFFGLAASNALRGSLLPAGFQANLSEPRSKARKTGALRVRKSSTKKRSP